MSGWPLVRLLDVADSIDYGVTASAVQEPVGPKFLRITDIQGEGVNWDTVPYCQVDARKARASLLRQGDIVFARTGATTGKSFHIKSCPDQSVFASYLIRVRASSAISSDFLAHFFQSENYWSQVSAKAVGAAQPGINASKLGELEIPLPPLEEQKRIAAILDQADDIRRKRQHAIDRLNQLGQALFHEMFGELLSADNVTENLGEVCDVRDGTHDSPKYVDEGRPLLTSKNFSAGYLDYKGAKLISEKDYALINKRSKVDRGDIVMPMIGTIGSPVIVDFEPDFAIKNVALIKFKNDRMNQEFVKQVLDGPLFQSHVANKGRGGTQKFISLSDIRDFKIPIPHINLQNAFAETIRKLRVEIVRNVGARSRIDDLFASLQHRAFTGQL